MFAVCCNGGGNVSVLDESASHPLQDPKWQLLAEFSATGEPGSEKLLAEQVTGAVQELGLQPAQVKRIRQAIQETLRKATQRGNPDSPDLPINIRIWVSGVHVRDTSQASVEAQQGGPQEYCSWGFFMIEKRGKDPQAPNVAPRHVIELFLYQERAHFR
jgi:hypothetical protein